MSETENFAVPHIPAGRKRKRRSSILKTVKPFDELQNIHSGGEKLHQKDRRVSFASTIKIKEFLKELPAQFGHPECPSVQVDENQVRTEQLPVAEDRVIQVSTPKGKNKRRRVSVPDTNRLSIIPKLEKSFTMIDDEDFEVWCETDNSPKAIASLEEITLTEKPAPSIYGDLTLNMTGFGEGAPLSNTEPLGPEADANASNMPPAACIPRECSDMDMSCNESGCLSLLSPRAFLPNAMASEKIDPIAHNINAVASPPMMGDSGMDMSLTMASTTTAPCIDVPEPESSNYNSVNMSFTVVQPIPEVCSLPPPSTQPVPQSDVQAACLPLPGEPSKVPVKLGLPSQKSSSLRLVVPSPVVRMPQSPYIGMGLHGTLFHTPLGPLSNLYGQLRGKGSLVSASRVPTTPCATEKSAPIQPKSPALLEDRPSMLLADVARDDARWLQDAKEASFALVDSSPDSSSSSTGCEDSTNVVPNSEKYTTPATHIKSPWLHNSQPCEKYLSELRSTIANLKVSAQDKQNETLVIETPETIALQPHSDAITTVPDILTDPASNVTLTGNTTLMNESVLLQKSLMMSPHAFSRFLEALQCDKSMCADSVFVSANDRAENEFLPESHLNETFTLPMGEGNKMENDTAHVLKSATSHPNADEEMDSTTVIEVQADTILEEVQGLSPNSTQLKADITQDAFHSPETFDSYLKDLHNRMSPAFKELDRMLSASDQHEAAQKCVKLLHSAAYSAVTGITLLVRYGELSGLSATHNWDNTDLPELSALPCVPLLGESKLNWLEDTHRILQEMYSLCVVVLGEAACLYPWQLEEVTDSTIELTLHERCKVKLLLAGHVEGRSNLPARAVLSMHTDPPTSIPQCNSTSDLPEVLWKLTQHHC